MTSLSNRGLPLAAVLAAVAAVIGAASMLLPWYTVNVDAFAEALQQVMRDAGVTLGLDPKDINTGITFAVASAKDQAGSQLAGYNVFRPLSVAAHLAGAGGLLFVAFKVLSGTASLASQRGELWLGALIIGLRPVLGIVHSPTANGAKQLNLQADILQPSTGLYVAAGAAIMALLAAVWALLEERGDEDLALATAQFDLPPTGGAYVPGGAREGAPGPAATAHPGAHVPAPYMPTSPYVPGVPAQQQPPAPDYPQTAAQPSPPARPPSAPSSPAAPPVDRSGSVPPPGIG